MRTVVTVWLGLVVAEWAAIRQLISNASIGTLPGLLKIGKRADTWLDRLGDFIAKVFSIDWLFELLRLSIFVVLALAVPIGLVVLGAQAFLWATTGLWPDVPLAAALSYLGVDLSPIHDPQGWKWLARGAARLLDLPLWSVALWPPLGFLLFAVPNFIASYAEVRRWNALRYEQLKRADVQSYLRQAESGIPWAQNDLGYLYEKGWNLPQDYVRAHMWYNIAAVNHPPGEMCDQSARNRDRLARRMPPDQIAEAQRSAREWLEENQGHSEQQDVSLTGRRF